MIHTLPDNFQPATDCLKGKNILVTGAGDGIGRAAALAYSRYGATLILLGKTISKLETVYDEIEAAGGAQPAIYPMHLRGAIMKDFDDLHDTIDREFGKLHGLLHNASILGERRSIAQTSVESWNEVMQINLNSNFMLTKALLPMLDSAATASIIFTSSSVGRTGRAFWGAYAVSKFASEGLVQVLADELANTGNIRVNSLNPGPTNTAMRRTAYLAEDPKTNPDPEDIMPLYLYLMSDDSKGQTGLQWNAQIK
ncbi:MAG: NAD(P)-dependent dehydrogenase (short-subunit alcohol dehydrogenase family) [Bermanella sp.]